MQNEQPFTFQERPSTHQATYQEFDMDEETIDLRHYWRVLMRFKFGIAGLGILAGVIAVYYSLGLVNIFQSTATLLIEQNQRNIVSIEQVYGIDSSSREFFSTQSELLKSRVLAERVIDELNLTRNPEFVPQDDEENDSTFSLQTLGSTVSGLLSGLRSGSSSTPAVATESETEQRLLTRVRGAFQSKLSVSPVPDTDLVRITFESEDPRLAAEVANSLANNYIETTLEQRLGASQQASVWLSDRLQGLKETLDQSELRLQAFLEREQLVDIEGVASLKTQELDELTSQSVEARRSRSELEVVYRQIQQSADPDPEQLMNYPAILNHPAIQEVKSRVDTLGQNIAELSNRYGRNHPRMISLNAERASAQQDLARQVRQVTASIENDYQSALAREQNILDRLEQSKVELQEINRKSFELRELQREVATNQQLYDMFFTRFRETSETNDFQSSQAILVDPAVPAVNPSKPNRRQIVTVALMLGLMLGVALAFLRDLLDNTVKTPGDIEDRLNARTLGLVPFVKSAAQSSKEKKDKKDKKAGSKRGYLGLMEDSHSSFSESVRTIRTGVTLSSIDHPLTVIEVTSSTPDEGKTTVAVNLAISLGQLKRTLIIDADMRRPSLATTLGIPPNSRGLSDYIAGNAELKECIYRHKKTGIAVLPVGQVPPDPLELLSSEKFRNLLTELKEIYGHIILDTPPTQAVSDALIVGSLADATVYVVKSDSTPINAIRSGLDRLKQARAHVLGIVLNQVDPSKQSSYDYGGYYDSYGYSNSYSGQAGQSGRRGGNGGKGGPANDPLPEGA